jgi:hypothetical protein
LNGVLEDWGQPFMVVNDDALAEAIYLTNAFCFYIGEWDEVKRYFLKY